jgi:plasmid maintenance system antidote protein VapI
MSSISNAFLLAQRLAEGDLRTSAGSILAAAIKERVITRERAANILGIQPSQIRSKCHQNSEIEPKAARKLISVILSNEPS